MTMTGINENAFLFFGAMVFALGAVIGSFLNVVIWRIPRGESIIFPRSHCPSCKTEIKWYQNIPLLSWIALRGKCAKCRTKISVRYIFVEFITGALFFFAFLKSSGVAITCESSDGILMMTQQISFPIAIWIWISLMIIGSFIDYDHEVLPDFVTVGGMILGVISATVESAILFASHPALSALECVRPLTTSVAGLVFGFGLLWLVRYLGSKAFRREAMGMGDVFLMGAVGAMFGPVSVFFTLVVSAILGSICGVTLICFAKAKLGAFKEIPYGPYICAGCAIWMFFGKEIVQWYLSTIGVN